MDCGLYANCCTVQRKSITQFSCIKFYYITLFIKTVYLSSFWLENKFADESLHVCMLHNATYMYLSMHTCIYVSLMNFYNNTGDIILPLNTFLHSLHCLTEKNPITLNRVKGPAKLPLIRGTLWTLLKFHLAGSSLVLLGSLRHCAPAMLKML